MRGCLILVVIVVAACGPSPARQAADGRDRAGSWAATVKAAVDAWDAGLVPSHYVASTLDAAAKDLRQQATQLRNEAGAAAARPLDAVLRALPSVARAVARGDHQAARQAAAAVSRSVPPPPPPPSTQAAR